MSRGDSESGADEETTENRTALDLTEEELAELEEELDGESFDAISEILGERD